MQTKRWTPWQAQVVLANGARLRLIRLPSDDASCVIAAEDLDRSGLPRVATAMFQRNAEDPTAAAGAVVVDPAYRRMGLGTELLARLRVHALALGIIRLTADIAPENVAAQHLLKAFGSPAGRLQGGRLHKEVPLGRISGVFRRSGPFAA